MENKWKAIVGRIQRSKQKNVDEDTYQDTVECQFQLLGWYNIETRPTFNYGASNTLKPDIVLCKENKRVLPIEIKRPTNTISNRQISQLSSYMRHLKLPFGLYIGENIQLFYDTPDDENAVSVFKIDFDENSAAGIKFCQLFSYDNFDASIIENFCKEQLRIKNARNNFRKRIQEYVSPENVRHNIIDLLKEKFLNEGHDDAIIDIELKKLNISIGYDTSSDAIAETDKPNKHEKNTTGKKHIKTEEEIDLSNNEDIVFEIQSTRKGVCARGIYKEGKMIVLKGSEFTSNLRSSFNAFDLRNEVIKKAEKTTNGNYRLLEDFVFNSPSAAAYIIYGSSIDGWLRWKTKNGKTLDEVFRAKQ